MWLEGDGMVATHSIALWYLLCKTHLQTPAMHSYVNMKTVKKPPASHIYNKQANTCSSIQHHIWMHWRMPSNPLYDSRPLRYLYAFLCCSKATNVTIVCGPSLMKLGTHPLNIHSHPSCAVVREIKVRMPTLSVALMMRVFTTSTGDAILVATKPAMIDAVKCVVRLSFMFVLRRSMPLNVS